MPIVRRRRTQRRPRRRTIRRTQQVKYHVPRGVAGYGKPYQIAKLRYAIYEGDAHNLASSTGSLGQTIYRANDLFDPWFSGSGSQPRPFDQLMAQFRNFIVLGSKIVVDFSFGGGSSTSNSMICAVTVRDGSVAMSTAKDVMEHPRTSFKNLTAESDHIRVINKYSWRLTGGSDPLDNNHLYGTTAASPVEQFYYHLNAWCPNAGSENAFASGYIEYTAIFFHRINAAAS